MSNDQSWKRSQPDGSRLGPSLGPGPYRVIGQGEIGAKAQGLARITDLIHGEAAPFLEKGIRVSIPPFSVIATDHFDRFVPENSLTGAAVEGLPDEEIARAFAKAVLPARLMDDLEAFTARVRVPLAVRSSSLLEDSMPMPFAGVYETKLIPNSHPDAKVRLAGLADAVRQVYASTFLAGAREYLKATGHVPADEKMAVIIQEAVGAAHNDRFYPHVSGVARSYNFYPLGLARPEDGLAALALGLGRTISLDGVAWCYSLAYPHANPPYNTPQDLLRNTQREFWAIDLAEDRGGCVTGAAGALRRGPLAQGEESARRRSLVDVEASPRKWSLEEAEQDGVLDYIASTYDADNDRFVSGMHLRGPRLIDFAPILKSGVVPLTDLLRRILARSEEVLGTEAEVEFAMTFPPDEPLPADFGLLQVRPMAVSHAKVEVDLENLIMEDALAASESVLGNGSIDTIRDVVYVRPDRFSTDRTRLIRQDLEEINRSLVAGQIPYLLMGFGRWGSSDASAGIPVTFGQISGARVIVEATWKDLPFMLSQGTHFFHNITGFRVLYFSVDQEARYRIDWDWLASHPALTETEQVRHIRLPGPLRVMVDGRTSRGVILK